LQIKNPVEAGFEIISYINLLLFLHRALAGFLHTVFGFTTGLLLAIIHL
jgi:hypothetical protein